METIGRDELEAETAYFIIRTEQYFFTPDGIAGFWYDSEDEVMEQHGVKESDIVDVYEILDY